MKVYHYGVMEKNFVIGKEIESTKIPENATTAEPPIAPFGNIVVFNGNTWEVVPIELPIGAKVFPVINPPPNIYPVK